MVWNLLWQKYVRQYITQLCAKVNLIHFYITRWCILWSNVLRGQTWHEYWRFFIAVSFDTLVFKEIIYFDLNSTGTEIEIFHPLIQSPNATISWGRFRSKPGAGNSICVSHMGDTDLTTEAITCCLPALGVHSNPRAPIQLIYRCPKQCPNC